MAAWSYRVIQVQEDRVTMDGEQWLGEKDMEDPDAIDSCPALLDFLNKAGGEGWEAVGMVPIAFQQIYDNGGEIAFSMVLKRPA